MSSQILTLPTHHPFACVPLTPAVHTFIQVHGERDGAVVIASQHTTTAVNVSP